MAQATNPNFSNKRRLHQLSGEAVLIAHFQFSLHKSNFLCTHSVTKPVNKLKNLFHYNANHNHSTLHTYYCGLLVRCFGPNISIEKFGRIPLILGIPIIGCHS